MNDKLFLWINQSNGDTLLSIPVVKLLLESFPNLQVKFACYEDQSYLLKHLPIEVIPIKGDYKDLSKRKDFFKKN